MADEPTTLAALIEARSDARGDKPFLRAQDRVLSFSKPNRQVNRAANGLAGLGVKRGVGVSIGMPKSPGWLRVDFATQKLGAYAIPVSVALKGEGLRHVIDHSDSSILIGHPDCAHAILAVCGLLSMLEQIIVNTAETSEEWSSPKGWQTLAEVPEALELLSTQHGKYEHIIIEIEG